MVNQMDEFKPLFNQWLREALSGGLDAPCRLTGGLYLGAVDQLINGSDLYTDGCIRKSTTVGCRLIHDAHQSIAHNTTTQLAFNTAQIDTDGMTRAANRITIQTEGVYLFGLQAAWEVTTTTRYRFIELRYTDPGTTGVIGVDSNTGISGGGIVSQACYSIWNAYRGAVITANAYQWDTGGAPGATNLLFQWLYSPALFGVRLA